MSKTQTTEISKKPVNSGLAVLPEDLQGSWGAEESSSEDVILPLVLLMHGQSKAVLGGEKAVGEIIRSTDGKVLAKRNESFKIIPFIMRKTFRYTLIESKPNSDKKIKTWLGSIPWTPANTDTPFQVNLTGDQILEMFPKSRKAKELNGKQKYECDADSTYSFLCLLADPEMYAEYQMPMSVSFTRSSKKTGKKIADYFAQCKAAKKPPASIVWEIGSELITGGENDFLVFTSKQSDATKIEQLRECKKWFDIISTNSSKFKEDEVDDVETTAAKPARDDKTAEF